jgi:hypothetical protein
MWRSLVTNQFRFDPSKEVPQADLQLVAQTFRHRQAALFENLDKTVMSVEKLANNARARFLTIQPRLSEASTVWARASADADICRGVFRGRSAQ